MGVKFFEELATWVVTKYFVLCILVWNSYLKELGMEQQISQVVKGVNGQVELSYSKIDITRKGVMAFALHGFDGTKTIFLRQLTALQFKEAGNVTNGYIQFIFPGSLEDKGGLFSATKDENTVMFTKAQQPEFEKLREHIIARMDF